MTERILVFLWNNLGPMLNIAGSIMIAFSFGRNAPDASYDSKKGKKIYLAAFLRPWLFWFGLSILILGFLFAIDWGSLCPQE